MCKSNASPAGASTAALDTVSLTLPARAEFVAVCRLIIAGLGQIAGLDQETVGDLKLAVTEGCAHMIAASGAETAGLRVQFEVARNCWVVEVVAAGGRENKYEPSSDVEPRDLGMVIMRALVDEVALEERQDSSLALRLVKRL